MVLDTGTILSTSATDLNNTVLLDVVTYNRAISLQSLNQTTVAVQVESQSIHTFTRNDRSNNLASTQPHTSNLTLSRVGLLGLRNTSLQTHTLERWVILQRRGTTPARLLTNSAALTDLVVCRTDNRRAGELAGSI